MGNGGWRSGAGSPGWKAKAEQCLPLDVRALYRRNAASELLRPMARAARSKFAWRVRPAISEDRGLGFAARSARGAWRSSIAEVGALPVGIASALRTCARPRMQSVAPLNTRPHPG